jgi:hypothetical protein
VTKEAVIKETLSYSLTEFAIYTGLGITTIREAIDRGDLIPRFPNSKPIIEFEEGKRWLASLPTEKPARASA